MEPLLYGLRMMGYLTAEKRRATASGNWFFERWLRRVSAARASEARP